ncbi:SpoIIE family protein phosphatase [Streptomyces vinaceus]
MLRYFRCSAVRSSRLLAGWRKRSGRKTARPGTGQASQSGDRGEVPHPPERRWQSLLGARSVASQVFLLQLAVVVLLVVGAVVALVPQARRHGTDEAGERSLAVAEMFANSPGIVAALKSPDPTAVLQPRTEAVRKKADVDYIVALSPFGFRYTHPDKRLIGKHVTGSYQSALTGEPVQKTFDSSLGRAVDSTVAIFDAQGKVVGLVTVGITVKHVSTVVDRQLAALFASAGGALVLAAGGSALVSWRLRRLTHGLGPSEMTRMYEHHDAVLHAVREGVLIISGDGRLLLANDEARQLLELPLDAERRYVTDLGLAPGMTELLASGRSATDEVRLAGDRLLAVSLRPVERKGRAQGSVATLRDTTELRALAGRAEVARERLQLMYDAGVRIGTTLDVVRTAEELAEVAVPRFADFVTVELLDPVLRGEEPDGASTEMRRTAVRGIRDDQPLYPLGELIRFVSDSPVATGAAGGCAVLQADLAASGAWRAQDPERAQKVLDYGIHSLISVPLRARGVVLGMADFWRSDQERFDHDDLTAAEELAARAAVCIDNARRYTREHAMAVTLQRRLLPRTLAEQSAVEVAHRYLPTRAGVGGDWFDVIPLPGARVALVVGDVVGHGVHAAATMGRLRTAVHSFSTLELSPDEVLSCLDELVTRIDAEEPSEDESEGITGATCLYAVYDPATGRCVLARAGHLGPALVSPDGVVTFPDIPVSPPLGLGAGLPVENAELTLPAGSDLVLFTDGLIEDPSRDIDVGLELLRGVLGHPDRSPEQTCQVVLDALLPAHPRDDIALLIARTRMLDSDQIADWEVPSDPAAVSRVRAEATRQLEAWGLGPIAFATELILSELVTNAIRYGTQPISLRLLHDQNRLVCEVSDGSSTAPHIRRAKTTDEGGRGLFLVAQFAQRWGTRYTARSKIIWTEQSLHDGAAEPNGATPDILLDQWDDTSP